MPDIRSFFGGGGPIKSSASTPSQEKPAPKKPAGRGRPKKVISDDEDDVEEVKPKKSTPAKRKPTKEEPKEEETTSSAYFASSKPKKASATANGNASTPKKSAASNGSAPNSARRSARATTKTSYVDDDDDEDVQMKLDDTRDGGDDDIHADDFKRGRAADDYEDDLDEDDLPLRPRKQTGRKKAAVKDEDEDDEDDLEVAETRISPAKKSATKKRKVEDDSDEDETPKKKPRKSAGTSTAKQPRAKKEKEPDNSEAQKVLDSIVLTAAPELTPRDESRKFVYKPGAAGGNASATPAGAGTKDIPQGEPACLTGLTFVFTGVLESLGREEGQNLVKKYGGKVTSGPSSKTSFVVLGDEAGPKKVETIKKLGIRTINEDGLFELIRKMPAGGGDSRAAADAKEKLVKQEEKLKKDAEDEDRRAKEKIRQAEKEAKAAAAARGVDHAPKAKLPGIDSRLWVDKYAPDSMASVCGNKALVEKLQKWLREWPTNARKNFKQGGADGYGVFRAAMLHGPPGIGKTTSAHLVAKLEGYDVVESNASDTRSKKLVEGGLKGVLDTTSLLGYFAGDGKKVDATKKKLVLIMDEVDGMSAGDRGGVGALAAIAKKTNIPMILICNDRKLPKMKPFDFVTADFAFRRPTTDMIRARIMTICFREGFKLPKEVIDAIIEGARGDIRQIINMISTIKLDSKDKDMQFNDGKAMSKAWEKHAILKPWDIVGKILRAEMFSPASKATLNEKIELYFNDHEFSYLMLQENYLKTKMAGIPPNVPARTANLKALELAESAAESISDGDLVDRMIHGSQQHWSLMPTHAIFSFVRPASYVYGNLGAQVGFTSWLGNNSKQGKLSRYVKEIQAHTRLRTSADRHEIRQQYMPALWSHTVGLLNQKGLDAVPDVIDFMDQYYLTKDDYDALIELGLGPMDESTIKLESKTKAAFTRTYNQQSHPITHIKPGATSSAKLGGGVKRDKPDLEEAVEDEDVEEVVEEAADDDDSEIDLKKDKYIKAPKKKKAAAKPKATAASKGKGKTKKSKDESSDLDDDNEDEEPKPKKRGATGAGRGRGRGRGKG